MTGRGKGFVGFSVANLGVLAALLCSIGCEPKDDTYGCKPVDGKGGDVTGVWDVASFCPVEYERVTSNDWCSQVVWDANGVRQAYLGHPWLSVAQVGPYGEATELTVDADPDATATPATKGTYRSLLNFGPSPATTYFPHACLIAYGASGVCSDFEKAINKYFGYDDADPTLQPDPGAAWQSFNLLSLAFQPFYPQGLLPTPIYTKMTCKDAARGNGCDCSYNVWLVVHDTGAWTSEKGTILSFYSDTAALPYDHDFTATDSSLQMSGHDGLDVFGQRGLRTLYWKK
jgi:hypothetical protein